MYIELRTKKNLKGEHNSKKYEKMKWNASDSEREGQTTFDQKPNIFVFLNILLMLGEWQYELGWGRLMSSHWEEEIHSFSRTALE